MDTASQTTPQQVTGPYDVSDLRNGTGQKCPDSNNDKRHYHEGNWWQ